MDNANLEVLKEAQHWLDSGDKVALLTLVKTLGSSPRPTGSLMAINSDGSWVGSISGGCVEQDVLEQLGRRFPHKPIILHYGEGGSLNSQRLLPCGGGLELIVEPLDRNTLHPVIEALQLRQHIQRHLNLSTGQVSFHYGQSLQDRQETTKIIDDVLIQEFGSRVSLLLIGATYISRYIVEMAPALDFNVIVCEPRPEYVESWPLSNIEVKTMKPEDMVQEYVQDEYYAIVALTHDQGLDDETVLAALASKAFYIGVLGSQRTIALRRERLVDEGVTYDQLRRLHGPVGLPIGSHTPAEIAISILSELILERNKLSSQANLPIESNGISVQ